MGAELSGAGDTDITGAAGIRDAGEGHITFIAGKNYLKEIEHSRASAVLVPLDTPGMHVPLLRVKNPRLAFARAIEIFYCKPYTPSGISDRAAIGTDVSIGRDCSIHPFAVLAERARIGNRVTIYPHVYVGQDSVIDDDSVIYANVSIGHHVAVGKRVIIHSGAVIGSDGFGFVTDGGRHHKIPQVGGVIIEDDVEIGANCSIDRATLGNTLIKQGTKLDDQVHIAHNVTIGDHCLLAGRSAVAGSSTLGSHVVLAGGVGIGDHVSIGDRVVATAGSGIIHDIEPGQVVGGYYAMPHRDWLRVQAMLPKLPVLKKMLTDLEKKVNELKERLSDMTKGEQS